MSMFPRPSVLEGPCSRGGGDQQWHCQPCFWQGFWFSSRSIYIHIYHIYMYIYIYTYICIHMYICVYIYKYVNMNISLCLLYTHLYVSLYIPVYIKRYISFWLLLPWSVDMQCRTLQGSLQGLRHSSDGQHNHTKCWAIDDAESLCSCIFVHQFK